MSAAKGIILLWCHNVHIYVDAQIVARNRAIPCIINLDVCLRRDKLLLHHNEVRSWWRAIHYPDYDVMQELKCKVNTKINYEIVF